MLPECVHNLQFGEPFNPEWEIPWLKGKLMIYIYCMNRM